MKFQPVHLLKIIGGVFLGFCIFVLSNKIAVFVLSIVGVLLSGAIGINMSDEGTSKTIEAIADILGLFIGVYCAIWGYRFVVKERGKSTRN